jgi:hypothetical protein
MCRHVTWVWIWQLLDFARSIRISRRCHLRRALAPITTLLANTTWPQQYLTRITRNPIPHCRCSAVAATIRPASTPLGWSSESRSNTASWSRRNRHMYSFTHSQAAGRAAALDQPALDHETFTQKASTLHQQCSDIPSRPPPSCTSDQRRYNSLLQSVLIAAATVEWTSLYAKCLGRLVVDNGRRGGEYSWSRVVGWASGRRQQGKKTLKAKGASKSCCLWVDLWSSRI